MKRHPLAVLGVLVGLAVGLSPSPALAQEVPVPAPGAPVRVHLSTYRGKGTARLYIHRTDGSYTFVCASPCTADMAAHSELRVTLANNDEEPHTFAVPDDLGSEIDVEVRPASVGPLVGSIVLMGSGGAFMLSGAVFIALSDISYAGASSARTPDGYKTIGYVMLGIGVGAAIGGLVWLLTRSHEPKVDGAPHRAPDVYGRRDTLLGDVAVQKPHDPTTSVLPQATPFELHFTF
jgi:hypothetical protein